MVKKVNEDLKTRTRTVNTSDTFAKVHIKCTNVQLSMLPWLVSLLLYCVVVFN